MAFFEIKNLTKSFGGLKAVDNLNLAVEEKEIFSIIGPNGAGKSTIFNNINGLYTPDSGEIIFKGQSLIGKRPDQIAQLGIARTFQNLELFANMTTMDNLLLGRHNHMSTSIFGVTGLSFPWSKAAKEEINHRKKVEEIIDFLELEASRNQFTSNAGLTQEERDEMIFWIKDIRDLLGVTVILIEHNMQMVKKISDRILAINFGNPITIGTPTEVLDHPEVISAYLGEEVKAI